MPDHHEAIERMIERILTDPEFRAQYLRDPAAAAESAGFAELAADLALHPCGPIELSGRRS